MAATKNNSDEKVLTGRKVFLIFASGFAVIIAVNFTMAWLAVGTFPGLEVSNSYVASQQFDEDRARQQALGWQVEGTYTDGQLLVQIRDKNGAPVEASGIEATLARRTHQRDDFQPDLRFDGMNYVSEVELESGTWQLRLLVTAPDGTQFRQRHDLLSRAVASGNTDG